ncbi:uncharacterized protein LOC124368974 [Homalodisca vitripennis]|uniref:uncharacterized protein LOC124368974 n=1 Tax=Homalodisca vitripennis TaxID=197043 RepID=UPI001EEB576D|nr:uncharacterized protein LOC124368974 [Homalodisca vitripennis]
MAYIHSCFLLLTLAVAVALSLDIASAKPGERERDRAGVGVVGLRSVANSKGIYPLRRRFTARGCSSFGHSCFGGHGKRADEQFPAPDYQADQEPGEEKLPDQYRQADIVPLLRQWLQLQSYRRMAEGNNN